MQLEYTNTARVATLISCVDVKEALTYFADASRKERSELFAFRSFETALLAVAGEILRSVSLSFFVGLLLPLGSYPLFSVYAW